MIAGRGELHLAVLIENMRREGYEMEVAKPKVIYKKIDGEETIQIKKINIFIYKMYITSKVISSTRYYVHKVVRRPKFPVQIYIKNHLSTLVP